MNQRAQFSEQLETIPAAERTYGSALGLFAPLRPAFRLTRRLFYKNSELKVRSMAILGGIFVILAIMFSVHIFMDIKDDIHHMEVDLLSNARLIASQEQIIVERGERTLNELLVEESVSNPSSKQECERFLDDRLRHEPVSSSLAFVQFVRVGLEGLVQCSSSTILLKDMTGEKQFFASVLSSRKMIVGDTKASKTLSGSLGSVLLFGKSTSNKYGNATGALVLVMDSDWLVKNEAVKNVADSASIMLVDSQYNISVQFPDTSELKEIREPLDPDVARMLSQSASGTFELQASSRHPGIFGAYVPYMASSDSGGYRLVLTMPKKPLVIAALVKAFPDMVMLTVLMAAALLGQFYGIDHILLRPIKKLTIAASRIKDGDLTARSGLLYSSDELGQLAFIVDESSSAMEARAVQLYQQSLLLQNVNDAVIARDMANQITYWNKAAERLYGWTAEEAVGNSWEDLLEVDEETFTAGQNSLIRSGRWVGEFWKSRKDGSVILIRANWALLRDPCGKLRSIVSVDRDITEQRQTEERLRESEERLINLTETIDEVLWIADPAAEKVLYVSPAYERIWGQSADKLYKSFNSWLDAVVPEDRWIVEDALIRQTLEDGCDVTYRIRRSDQGVRLIHHRTFRRLDDVGNVMRVVGVAEDITEKSAIEERLRQSQKMEAIGNLAGGVAHDFNNLLTIILGYTDMLKVSEPNSTATQFLERISDASERAASLTRQLLSVSRKSVLQPVILNLNESISNFNNMLKRLIREDIEYRTFLAPDIHPVKMDPSQMDQVLMNIVINAVDAMPAGGIITVETSSRTIYDDLPEFDVKAGNYVMVAISDSGSGMTAEVRSRIFEPFFTTKELGKGTGLGLATVFGIIKQSGGFISVHSEVGHGTTFKIMLPAAVQNHAPVHQGVTSYEQNGSETILVIEDDDAVREVALLILQSAGYKPLFASNGEDSLALVRDYGAKIDLVLTDVVMPKMGGPELFYKLKEILPQTKVLFMSGYTDDIMVRQGLLKSKISFVHKPFTPRELLHRVRSTLDSPILLD